MESRLRVPIPQYPWPTIHSPLSEALEEESFTWYREDHDWIPPDQLEKYRSQKLSQCAAGMSPTITSVDRLRPITRMFICITLFDDYFEVTPVEELEPLRDRICEVLLGATPHPDEPGYLRQMAQARREWLEYMPEAWMERYAYSNWQYLTYGVMEEFPFRLNNTRPSIARCLMLRQHAIWILPYTDMAEASAGLFVPDHIFKHPTIQRIRVLAAIIIAMANDISTVEKEMRRENEIMNTIFIIQHERSVTMQEACSETFRIHDESVEEMFSLQRCLPDFGPHNKLVEDYVNTITMEITGLNHWYFHSGTRRYQGDHNKFIIPQYGKGDIAIPFEVEHYGDVPRG